MHGVGQAGLASPDDWSTTQRVHSEDTPRRQCMGSCWGSACLRRGREAVVRALVAVAVVPVELPELGRLVPGVEHGNALLRTPALMHTDSIMPDSAMSACAGCQWSLGQCLNMSKHQSLVIAVPEILYLTELK